MRDLEKRPGNGRIAVALLDALTASGDTAARDRAVGVLGAEGRERRRRGDSVPTELLERAFAVAGVDRSLARRVGRSLIGPGGVGLLLGYAGLATPEKAYRRSDQLLASERAGDRFEPDGISAGRARIRFHPDPGTDGAPQAAAGGGQAEVFCWLRVGMLEAVPTLYGLLPARVRETECVHRGDRSCAFEVAWRRSSRIGLWTGALVGVCVGIAAPIAAGIASGTAVWVGALASVAFGLVGAASGRSLDLARQLAVLSRGGLGQLALLDQVDGALAEKMDALARLGRTPETGRGHTPRLLGSSELRRDVQGRDERGERDRREPPAAVSISPELPGRMHRAIAALERPLEELQRGVREDTPALVDACLAASRELRAVGVELSEGAERRGAGLEPADLAELVRRGVAAVRPSQPSSLSIDLQIGVDPAPLRCRPFQVEQVVIQLLLNAAEAMHGMGRVDVALRGVGDGYEIAISDTGDGIDPEILDQVFDPFFAPPAGGPEAGLGLTVCYRIAKQHGGELAVQSEAGRGTRVAVTLPAALAVDQEAESVG